jgi:L-alanine-DL-glutamate epimerase-like enolase superfamily enzyme
LIRSIRPVPAAIPLTKTRPIQQWVEEWSTQLFVKVLTSDRTVGWGEILPSATNSREAYVSILKRIAPNLVGQAESNPKSLWTKMRRLTFSGGYGVTTGSISGIDIALWDLAARRARVPLYRLLRGRGGKVKRYASLSRYKRTEDAVKVVGSLIEDGFDSVKLHQTSEDSLEAIRKARVQYGNSFELMADLNCALGFSRAADFMREVQRYELKWVEEPVWPPDDFESLQKLNRIGPVGAGENFFSYFEFKRLMEMDALSYYQPDVMKIGGVTPAIEIIRLAKTQHVKVAFHCRPHNGWIGAMASAHLAALLPETLVETPPNGVPVEYFSFAGSLDSHAITPRGPGLGIAPKSSIPTSNTSKLLAFH